MINNPVIRMFIVAAVAATAVAFIVLRSGSFFYHPESYDTSSYTDDSSRKNLHEADRVFEALSRTLVEYKDNGVNIAESYRQLQETFPKAHSRYSGDLTAAIEQAMKGKNPDNIPNLERKLQAHHYQVDTYEMRLNNLQPSIGDILHKMDLYIAQINTWMQRWHGLSQTSGVEVEIVGETVNQEHELLLDNNKFSTEERDLLLIDYHELRIAIEGDMALWIKEIKNHNSFLKEFNLFLDSIPNSH